MTTNVPEWREVAKLSDLAEGAIHPIQVLGRELVLILKNRQVLCFTDQCSHQPVKLSEFGEIFGSQLVCHAHGARFDLCDQGKALCFPARADLEAWSVRVTDANKILIFI